MNCCRLCLEDSATGAHTMEAEEAHDGHKCGSTEDDVEKMAVMNGAMRCKVASIVGEERR